MSLEALFEKNPLCRMLGIKYPICQAGMYQVAYGKLAAAASEAGGLGVIGAAYMTAEQLREEIRIVRGETDRPFGVDILFARVEGQDAASSGYTQQVREHIEVTFDEDVPVLVSGLGNPGEIIADAHAKGMTVMSLVGTSRQAKAVAASGVDVVIASGHEGGGHVGRIGTLSLVPRVVDSVDLPVLAAGGLVNGRGLMAALALGAVGVWMGTRFIATDEARGHINYKQKIVEIDEDGTVVSRAHSGKPNRMIRNDFTRSWEGREGEIKPYPHQMIEVGGPASIRGRIEGDVENGVLAAGQGSGLIDAVKPAGEVVRDIVEEAREVLAGWQDALG
ncbi:MAG: nitronate monooxygenase family protein [Alphaproteobacteria bacterium]|nr:nitronate monooxygenase family protein [Alphaproteobacteria bacterium]